MVADDHDASALAHQLHGLCKGALGTDGIVHHIGTALCGELRQLSAVQCTQLCGQLHGPGVVAAYADLCALTFCGDQGHQANGAVTDHGSGLPGGKAAAQHGVHSHGKRLHKAALLKADGGRQGIQSAGLYGDVLGHGTIFAVLGAGNAYDAALCAEVVHPVGAEPAVAAVFGGIKGDAVAHGPALHGFAQLRNGAAGFVAHDQRRDAPPVLTAAAVHIAAADGAGLYLHQHLVWCRFRAGNIPVFKGMRCGEHQCFHHVYHSATLPSSCLQTGFFQLCGVWPSSSTRALFTSTPRPGFWGRLTKPFTNLKSSGFSA